MREINCYTNMPQLQVGWTCLSHGTHDYDYDDDDDSVDDDNDKYDEL